MSFEETPSRSRTTPNLSSMRQEESVQGNATGWRPCQNSQQAHFFPQQQQLIQAAEAVVNRSMSSTATNTDDPEAPPESIASYSSRQSLLLREGRVPLGFRPPHGHRDNHNTTSGSTSIPIIVSDDVVSGTKREGWMSPVRRFFCLLVTFDFLFTGLLWVITVLVTGRDIKRAMKQQILHYTIYDSMFDCVIGGALRFLLSILFYAALDLSHWWPVAVTTTATSAFTIAKVFEYQWSKFGYVTFDVMLVLLSFILAWGELWFLDFRVLPLEFKAQELQAQFEESEHAPLLISVQGAQRALLQRYVEGSLWDGSVANFYSPVESPEDSGDEVEEETLVKIPRKFKRRTSLVPKEVEYRRKSEDAFNSAWRIMNSTDWKLEKEVKATGDIVHSKEIKGRKVFRLTATITLPPGLLLEELFFHIEDSPSWTPTILECRSVQIIDSHTDITYQVCAEGGNGIVSTRDFVNLRHWKVFDQGLIFSAVTACDHPAIPPQPKRIRGANGPGGFALRPVEGDPSRCVFQWLLDTDLKGWIPKYIIESALCGAQLDYVGHLRQHANRLQECGKAAEFMSRQNRQRLSHML